MQHVRTAADLAVFYVTLAEACGVVDLSVIPLAATRALESGFHSQILRLRWMQSHIRNPIQPSAMTMELPGFCGSYFTEVGSPIRHVCRSTHWRSCVMSCDASYATPPTSY